MRLFVLGLFGLLVFAAFAAGAAACGYAQRTGPHLDGGFGVGAFFLALAALVVALYTMNKIAEG